MGKALDLAGRKFGMLTAASREFKKGTSWYWRFICDCGNEKVLRSNKVIAGETKSCGCLVSKVARKISTTHGWAGTPEYNCWLNLRARCVNPNLKSYADYGARGIAVCNRWKNSFRNFLDDMGPKPEPKILYSIDRIDNNGNYEPENCRWTTRDVQRQNQRCYQ